MLQNFVKSHIIILTQCAEAVSMHHRRFNNAAGILTCYDDDDHDVDITA